MTERSNWTTPQAAAAVPLVQLNHASPYQAALAYAERGWQVFPVAGIVSGHCGCRAGSMCDHPGKHPLNRNGLRAATTDNMQIARWWQTWPWAGVAIRTGAPSGLVVVDIDPTHGGLLSLDELSRSGAVTTRTLETLAVRSGGAGYHLYYQHPHKAVSNTNSQLPRIGPTPGLDLKGDGGSIIAPPSPHPSGRRYQWAPGAQAPAELPKWAQPRPPTPRPVAPQPTTVMGEDRLARSAQAALEGETATVAAAVHGQRNHVLNRAAYKLGTLVGAGALDQTLAESSLSAAAQTAGLSAREATATIQSGLTDGIANPRLLPVTPPMSSSPHIHVAP